MIQQRVKFELTVNALWCVKSLFYFLLLAFLQQFLGIDECYEYIYLLNHSNVLHKKKQLRDSKLLVIQRCCWHFCCRCVSDEEEENDDDGRSQASDDIYDTPSTTSLGSTVSQPPTPT